MYFLNSWSAMAGILLIHGNLCTGFMWLVLAGFTTMVDHSGYHLPMFNSPHFHDYHHEKYLWIESAKGINSQLTLRRFVGNYGFLGWMDLIHGTDKSFRSSKHFAKHRFLIPFVTKPCYEELVEENNNKVEWSKGNTAEKRFKSKLKRFDVRIAYFVFTFAFARLKAMRKRIQWKLSE